MSHDIKAGAAEREMGASMLFSRRGIMRMALMTGVVAMIPGAFAQGQSPKHGGTLTIGADADPIGFDPTTLTSFSSFDFTSLIYSGLLRWNAQMQIEPDLATGYEMPDETTFVFKLRAGVKFHNGQEFTAEDVKHTFDCILDPATSSRLRAQYGNVQSVTVLDPLTVQFKLATTDAAFLNYLASNPDGAIIPRGVDSLNDLPIGTGPFMFDTYQPNQQLTLAAFPDYFEAGLPYFETVIFRFYKDQATLTSALRSRAIDMTWLKDPRIAAQVAGNSSDLVSAPGQTSRTFPVWINKKTGPLADVRVRQALSLATDREACLRTVLGGSGKVAAMLPESTVGGYDGVAEMPYYRHDPAAAKELLAEAGFGDGIDLGDYLVVAANPLDVACAQVLQQQWAAAGITVAINTMETAPLLQMYNQGTYPALLSVALAWSPDPDAILQRMVSTTGHGQAQGMADLELDAMIAAARADNNRETRADKHQAIQQRIADNAYVLQIYQFPLRWEMWWNDIFDYQPLASNTRSNVRTAWRDA